MKDYIPVKSSKSMCLLIIGGMIFIYSLDNLSLGKVISNETYYYIIKPLLYLVLGFVVWLFPRPRFKASIIHKNNIIMWAFGFGIIHVLFTFCVGFIDGFGKSPYSHSFMGILINVFGIASRLIGQESARSFIVNNLTKKERYIVFIPLALFTTLLNYPLSRFIRLKETEEIVKLFAQYIVPDFCQNLFATYLSFLCGWFPSLAYMGTIQAFNWLSPILPNLKWISAALVGIMCPVFSLSVMQNIHLQESKEYKRNTQKEGTFGWIATSILSIGIIWFAVGVFPIYPSVIATGSMKPLIHPGDMVLISKMKNIEDIDNLKEGDIIQFKRGNILITHRIVEILNEKNVKQYRTKGDNNSVSDKQTVKPEDIKGRMISVIPKVGWPTLLLKSSDDIPIEDVEF